MNGGVLARSIREKGREVGLTAVGFASVVPSRRAGVLQDWLAAGHAGTMGYMERTAEARVDARRRLSWARTAVAGAVAYLPYKDDRDLQPGLAAHVARYALGRDYHAVLRDRLGALARFIQTEAPGARTAIDADTGPVLERELAEAAGLGWFGKNTNLIGPRGNSWILLGQIFTDLDLPPDDPVADRCGSCTACIDACPTGALPEPYVVDARRCISYLTIELRGAVPAAQRADLGSWAFGCDVCQEVCPWNRKAAPVEDAAFVAGEHLTRRSLADLVRLDDAGYRRDFRSTAMERARRRGLVRNALIVAGNTEDGPAVRAAEDRLEDPDPVLRGAAAWTIGQAGEARALRALERRRVREDDPGVRAEIDAAVDAGGAAAGNARQTSANSGRLR